MAITPKLEIEKMRHQRRTLYEQPKFAKAAHYFELACLHSREHTKLAKACLDTFGDHGPDVSGVVRDHFPDMFKDILRNHARKVTYWCTRAHDAKPSRVHASTMTALGQQVATRDGSGFYGPQPYR